MQDPTPKNITIQNRTLVYLGEITQRPNSNKLMLRVADLDVWGAHKDCSACYLFSADGVARYLGETHCLGRRMPAYFEEIALPTVGRSTSGDQPNQIGTAYDLSPQPGQDVKFGDQFRISRMMNDLKNGKSLQLWGLRVPLDPTSVNAQCGHEIERRQDIEREIGAVCKDDLRFLRCRPNDSGYSGEFPLCKCEQCHYYPVGSPEWIKPACSCPCRYEVA
jgi:hypothetical protein